MTVFIKRGDCAVCGSLDNSILLSKAFVDSAIWNFLEDYYEGQVPKEIFDNQNYQVSKCDSCGFIWQFYSLNDDLAMNLYNSWISPEKSFTKKKYSESDLFSGYAAEAHAISSLIKKNPHEIDVLDFGMGWGYWCLMAKAFGYKVSGFEITSSRIDFARNNGLDVIENFGEIMNRKFDFINAEQVFEHIDKPLQTLEALVSTLKEGGVIRIAVPDGNKIEKEFKKSDWKASKNAIHPLEHINCFTHKTLRRLGESAGLKLIKQPILAVPNASLFSTVKSVCGRFYRQHFGTVLYFSR